MVLPGALASGFFVCFKGFKYYNKKSLKIIPQKVGNYKRLPYLCIVKETQIIHTPD